MTLRIPAVLEDNQGSIGVGAGAVWAVTTAGEGVTSKEYNHSLSRLNSKTGVLEATVHLPAQGASVIYADGSVWITGINKAELYRLDPLTNQIVATIGLHKRPRFMTAGDGAIWVANQGDGTVQRVNTKNNSIDATIETGAEGGGGDIAFGSGNVWVTTRESVVIKIDPKANVLIGRYKTPPKEHDIGDHLRYGADSLWMGGGNIFRIAPP